MSEINIDMSPKDRPDISGEEASSLKQNAVDRTDEREDVVIEIDTQALHQQADSINPLNNE